MTKALLPKERQLVLAVKIRGHGHQVQNHAWLSSLWVYMLVGFCRIVISVSYITPHASWLKLYMLVLCWIEIICLVVNAVNLMY